MQRRAVWIIGISIIFVVATTQVYGLSYNDRDRFSALLAKHGLKLDELTQSSTVRLLFDPQAAKGKTTYITGFHYIAPSSRYRGAYVLSIEFGPLTGPPGEYLLVLKTSTSPGSGFRVYDCVVRVEEIATVPIKHFMDKINEKMATGQYLFPPPVMMIPWIKGPDWPIPVVSEVECLK